MDSLLQTCWGSVHVRLEATILLCNECLLVFLSVLLAEYPCHSSVLHQSNDVKAFYSANAP